MSIQYIELPNAKLVNNKNSNNNTPTTKIQNLQTNYQYVSKNQEELDNAQPNFQCLTVDTNKCNNENVEQQSFQLVTLSPGGTSFIPIDGNLKSDLRSLHNAAIAQQQQQLNIRQQQQSQYIILPPTSSTTTTPQKQGLSAEAIQMIQSNNSQQLSTTATTSSASGSTTQPQNGSIPSGSGGSVPIQVVNLADGAAFIPIGNSPFFQIASSGNGTIANGNNNNNNNLINSIAQQIPHSGTITLTAEQYSQLTNSQGNGLIEIIAEQHQGNSTSGHSPHESIVASTSQHSIGNHEILHCETPDRLTRTPSVVGTASEHGEEPIYVNAKQYDRILIRRAARARLEAQGRLPKERRKYMHESRHRHAISRARGGDGKYQNGINDSTTMSSSINTSNRIEENLNNGEQT